MWIITIAQYNLIGGNLVSCCSSVALEFCGHTTNFFMPPCTAQPAATPLRNGASVLARSWIHYNKIIPRLYRPQWAAILSRGEQRTRTNGCKTCPAVSISGIPGWTVLLWGAFCRPQVGDSPFFSLHPLLSLLLDNFNGLTYTSEYNHKL